MGWRLIRRLRPHAVHAWNDRLGLIAAFAALLAGTPRVLIHFHHMRPTRDPAERETAARYPAAYRHLLARPELRFTFCSQAALDDYAAFWNVDPVERMIPLHNGFPPVPAITAAERAAARARFGFDRHRLPGLARDDVCQNARQNVSRAAAGRRRNDPDPLGGP